MGLIKPKYREGDWALYRDDLGVNLMKITGTAVRVCHGDVLPHRYYDGNLSSVEEIEGRPSFRFTTPLHTTTIINVRENQLEEVALALVP